MRDGLKYLMNWIIVGVLCGTAILRILTWQEAKTVAANNVMKRCAIQPGATLMVEGDTHLLSSGLKVSCIFQIDQPIPQPKKSSI
jgi:hypothetical protein